jgi:uncharacterized membrane protein
MEYLWIKLLHILSSTLLFGTGIGTACVMLYGYFTSDVRVIAAITRYVVLADWIFTATSGLIQPITGFWMIHIAHFPLNSFWIVGSIIGYLIAAFCWFPVVFLQMRMRDLAKQANIDNTPLPPQFHYYFKWWFCLGWPAFFSLIIVFYLMTNKP